MKKVLSIILLSVLFTSLQAQVLPTIQKSLEIECTIPGHGFGCSGETLSIELDLEDTALLINQNNNFRKIVNSLNNIKVTIDSSEVEEGKFLVQEGLNEVIIELGEQDIDQIKLLLDISVSWDY